MVLVVRYRESLSLQTKTKLRKFIKSILNCWKLQIVFKNENKLSKAFCFKDCINKVSKSDVVSKFQCGLCGEAYYGEYVRHPNVRIGENIRISPLTKKKVKPKGCAVRDLCLLCNHSTYF